MDPIDRAQEQEAANTKDALAKRTKEKREQEAKRKQALSDYSKLVSDVEDLKVMCDTRAFKTFVRRCRASIEDAKTCLLTADKPRDIAHHQEAVRVLTVELDKFRDPVDELNKYISDMPLFAQEMKTRAQWLPDLFTVELRTL